MSPEQEPFRNARNSTTPPVLIPRNSLEDWSQLDSVSNGHRPKRWFSLPFGRVLLASPVGSERRYGGRLAWKLVRWRDQEAPGRVEPGGEGDQGCKVQEEAELEDNVSEMRAEGWEPRWESYRETQTGVLVRRIVYSVVMERKQRKLQVRGFRHILKRLFPGKQYSSRTLT